MASAFSGLSVSEGRRARPPAASALCTSAGRSDARRNRDGGPHDRVPTQTSAAEADLTAYYAGELHLQDAVGAAHAAIAQLIDKAFAACV